MARPREFDRDEALDKATRLFWAKGYHDSSVRDVVAATGVNQYGLYAAFEDKHGLYLAALDRYGELVTREVLAVLRRPGPLRDVLRDTFGALMGFIARSGVGVGCMMCNAAVELAPHDPDAAARVQAHMKRMTVAFAARLTAAQQDGDLDAAADVRALAEFLTATAYTLGVLARTGQSRAYLARHLETALAAVT